MRGVEKLTAGMALWRCRRALWAGFVRACERVERDAAMAGEDPNAAVLDWFGVSVKASEIPAHLQRMKTLARKVCPYVDTLRTWIIS